MQKVEFNFEISEEAEKEKEAIVGTLKKSKQLQAWLNEYKLEESFLERHAYKFKDYLERIEKCKGCNGLSMCMQDVKGYILELKYDGALSKNVTPCKYAQKKETGLAHHTKFLLCDMSDEQLTHTFKEINFENEKDSYMMLVNEMKKTIDENQVEGFFLGGEPGTGKTYLACCFVNAMAKKGKRCAFINVSNYFSTLKSKMYDKDAYGRQIEALKKAEVAVFDDIGGESVSNWTRDEILLPILNERMEKKLTTLFTSNYSLENLQKYYAINSKLVNDEVGAKRLVERIKALTLEKVLNCNNRRLKKSRNLM